MTDAGTRLDSTIDRHNFRSTLLELTASCMQWKSLLDTPEALVEFFTQLRRAVVAKRGNASQNGIADDKPAVCGEDSYTFSEQFRRSLAKFSPPSEPVRYSYIT